MIVERALHQAYRMVAERAAKALKEGKPDDAKVAEKQMAAIRELETKRREIFEQFGVEDVQPVRGLKQPYQELEELKRLTFGQLLKTFRKGEGLTQEGLASNTSICYATINRLENNLYAPTDASTESIIAAFGWDMDDWQAQLLMEKARERRAQRKKKA